MQRKPKKMIKKKPRFEKSIFISCYMNKKRDSDKVSMKKKKKKNPPVINCYLTLWVAWISLLAL